MKKKIFLTIFLLLILLANVSFASYSTVTMTVVEEPICKIEFAENSGFEKKLISKDLTNKEVTIQLQVTNNELASKPTGEVVLVLDNSESMTHETSTGEIRKDLIYDSAKTLITNLLKDNTELKIGIVSFSTNIDMSKQGTIEDANLISDLSNNTTTLISSISNIEANGPRTNLESGLSLGSKLFTDIDNNKYMIVLTDGVPNVAIDFDKYYFSDDVISKTKTELQRISDSGINVSTLLTGISNEDALATRDAPNEDEKTYKQIIEEIFGTTAKPTSGNFYYITDDKIEETITNEIYNSLIPSNTSFKDITIVDYFPKEIVDNFDFAYVTEDNIGLISTSIDTTNNSITWTIPELAVGETATVQYKLKLKENFDSSIVDKILDTNEKVDVSYTNFDDEKQEKTSDVTPKLKLSEPPAVLPKAGITTLIITFSVLAGGLFIFSVSKLILVNKKMK